MYHINKESVHPYNIRVQIHVVLVSINLTLSLLNFKNGLLFSYFDHLSFYIAFVGIVIENLLTE